MKDQDHNLTPAVYQMDLTIEKETTTEIEALPVLAASAPRLTWLTGEILMYTLIVALALSWRLLSLGAYPLNDPESAQALVAWEVYQGRIPAEASGYSPLMVSLNSLTFLFFGASDTTVRLGSVLLGLALVLLPYGLRRQLGRPGALVASALFALGASSVYWSRTVSGEMGVAVGALMILVGFLRWWENRTRDGLFLLFGGLVLLVTGAPSSLTALVIILFFGLLIFATNRQGWSTLQARLVETRTSMVQTGAVAGGLLLVLGTAAFFNLTGLAAISDMVGLWLGRFGLQPQPGAAYPAILLLILYEPLLLLFGGVAIVRSFWVREPLDWVLILWFGLVILLDVLMGGRSGGQILLAIIPLTLLAARQIGLLLTQTLSRGSLETDGVFLAFGLTISAFIYISLTTWSKCIPAQAGCNTAWVLPVAGLVLIVVLALIFWGWYGAATAWRGLGMVSLIAIGLFSIGLSWRLNHGPLQQRPFQLMISQPASVRLPILLADLATLSEQRVGEPTLIDIGVVGLDRPLLHWHLRNFENAHFSGEMAAVSGASLVLAPPTLESPQGGAYVGQDTNLIAVWRPIQVRGKDWLRYYIYRALPGHRPGSDEVVLWVRQGKSDGD